MKPILIQGQMDIETNYLFQVMKEPTISELGNAVYYSGTLDGYPCVMMNGHFGQANAAMNTALAIQRWDPCIVINQGTSGGHSADMYVGDVVLAEKVVNFNSYKTPARKRGSGSDSLLWEPFQQDIWVDGKPLETMEFLPDAKLYSMARSLEGNHGDFKVKSGVVVSGDCWNEEWDRIQLFIDRYHSACEEMELFSVAQVCAAMHKPWVGFRVLSNSIVTNGRYTPEAGVNAQKIAVAFAKRVISEYADMLVD